jgi:hypothetical protein
MDGVARFEELRGWQRRGFADTIYNPCYFQEVGHGAGDFASQFSPWSRSHLVSIPFQLKWTPTNSLDYSQNAPATLQGHELKLSN